MFSVETISTIPCWLSPTGRFLVIKSDDERSLSILDSKTMNRCGPGLTAKLKTYSFAWSSTEDHIVISSPSGVLQKWSNILESPELVAQSTQKHERVDLKFSPDDRFIASFDVGAKLWDASNLSLIWEYPGYWDSVAFHPLGKKMVFYNEYSLLDVNNEDSENIMTTQHQISHYVYDLIFCPSGNVYVARTKGGVRFLRADTFEEKSSFSYNDCTAMQITPNGKYILLILKSKEVVLWDIVAERAVEELSLRVHGFFFKEISRNCRVLRASKGNYEQFFHLMSTYY